MFKSLRLLIPFAPLFAYSVTPAHAQDVTLTVTSDSRDFFFTVPEESLFSIRSYAQQYGIDSMLWLYDGNGNLIAYNDDYYGLDSHIETTLSSGDYRLRAGVCCWNPDSWYGSSYQLVSNLITTEPTTTTSSTTTTTTSTTTTTTTTTEPPTTTTTTEPETTTTWVTTTTTSTTTPPVETTVVETTIVPVPTETTTSTTTTQPLLITTTSSVETTLAPATTQFSVATVVLPSSSVAEVSTTTTTLVSTTSTSSTVLQDSPVSSVSSTTTTQAPKNPEPSVTPDADFGVLTSDEISTLLEPENLSSLSSEEITTLVDSIANSDLTDEQAEAIAQAMTDAPKEVKEEFEATVDIFGGQFDSYVPIDSVISVGQRRVVIAATATAVVIPAAGAKSSRRSQ